MQPIVLGPNMPAMFYRGDGRIDRLRGTAGHADRPEDWIGSVTARFGTADDGMTRLPDGSLLASAVAADPVAWLGAAHVARYGSDTGLLVKLLDAGQRLPVHGSAVRCRACGACPLLRPSAARRPRGSRPGSAGRASGVG